jgi:hypothetical protein
MDGADFDAFLYFANWGSRRFMLRLPTKLLDLKTAASYCAGQNFSCHQKDDHIVLCFESDLEDYEWDEGKSWLASLVPLRSDLMRGDHRLCTSVRLLAVNSKKFPTTLRSRPWRRLGKLNAALIASPISWVLTPISLPRRQSAVRTSKSPPSRKEIDEWVRTFRALRKTRSW